MAWTASSLRIKSNYDKTPTDPTGYARSGLAIRHCFPSARKTTHSLQSQPETLGRPPKDAMKVALDLRNTSLAVALNILNYQIINHPIYGYVVQHVEPSNTNIDQYWIIDHNRYWYPIGYQISNDIFSS